MIIKDTLKVHQIWHRYCDRLFYHLITHGSKTSSRSPIGLQLCTVDSCKVNLRTNSNHSIFHVETVNLPPQKKIVALSWPMNLLIKYYIRKKRNTVAMSKKNDFYFHERSFKRKRELQV